MASSSIVMGLTALAFCTWAVSIAGIASVQDKCESGWDVTFAGINGLSTGLSCMSYFRYYWFIVSLEAVLIVGLGVATAAGAYAKTRSSWLGLFAVATLLYIQMSDMTLTMDAVTHSSTGQIKHRVRTWIAGSIMTATVNCMLIAALGMLPERGDSSHDAPVAEKAASAV